MSKIEVNTVEPQCGTTLTLGGSGDTVQLGSGASQTGFGRTGTVDWVTSIKVTGDSPITAVSGKGYFLNTSAGTITINLPSSPSAGDIVSIKDYARTFGTYNVTVGRGGSNMDGVASDTSLSTDGLSVTFIYMDGTKGWSYINEDTTTAAGRSFVTATVSGACNTLTTAPDCANVKIATFVNPGTFCVSCAGNPAGSTTVDYLVIAGGGGAAMRSGGGGGAGGYRFSDGTASGCYSAGPAPLGASAAPVSVQGYAIVVGGGGAGVPGPTGTSTSASNGQNSSFSSITSTGGGGSIGHALTVPTCANDTSYGAGGSGAGGSAGGGVNGSCAARNGNNPPVSPSQGKNGGIGVNNPPAGVFNGGGGGGAGQCGAAAVPGAPFTGAGNGGDGLASSITGAAVTRGGGGGGSTYTNSPGQYGTDSGEGGTGGGGNGGQFGGALPDGAGINGTAETGGGGGGSIEGPPGNPVTDWNGGSGGSGIVIIRYKFQ